MRWLFPSLAHRRFPQEPPAFPDAESKALFLAEDREVTKHSVSILCVIALILVPLASILDHFAYPEFVGHFLLLRLLCALVLLGLLWSIRTEFAARHYRAYTVIVPMAPAFVISCMIYIAKDPGSAYYAGLTLCLVAIGFMFHWTYREGLLATLLVLAMYSFATIPWLIREPAQHGIGEVVNNFIFIVLNGVVIVSGAFFHYRIRVREFVSRLQLDRNRHDLEASNQQLRDLDQLKNDFLANVSHELRTPLTLLLAPLQSLRSHDQLTFNQVAMVDTMHQQALRLLKLINDLLDIAKLESGQLELRYETIDVRKFVDDLTDSIAELGKQRNISITAHTSPEVTIIEADRDKLEKICLNLLFNAIKFTPEFGRIHLGVSLDEDTLVWTIKDTGVGIPQERLTHIFERFWQEDSSTKRKHPGTGIGLALVKELTEAMGGAVSVESEPNRGTSMIVRLQQNNSAATTQLHDDATWLTTSPSSTRHRATSPSDYRDSVPTSDWLSQMYRQAEFSPAQTSSVRVARSKEPTTLASVSNDSDLKGGNYKVVIADDEPGMRAFLAGELVQHYQIIEAVDGIDAVNKTNDWKPDLILLDYMMPGLDGFEVCRKLRAQHSTRMMPIMLLTAKADEQTRLQGLEAGANDVLIKPFSLVEFHTRVRNLLRSHTLQKDLEAQKAHVELTLDQLRETESQLVQSEKLAAVGQMSAGILHEINNPLHFSISALFTLSKRLRNGPASDTVECREIISDLKEGLNRVSTIVSDLRDFTHPDTGKRTKVRLSEVITVTHRLIGQRIREEDIQVHTDIDDRLMVLANKNRLVQVFINLFQNACDALQGRFTRRIEVAAKLDQETQQAVVTIHDTGHGIPNKALNRLFDPFFTTKEVGKGTGLGLSICYRLIKELDGNITVTSEPNMFTTFELRIPLAEMHTLERQTAFAGAAGGRFSTT